MKEERQIFQCNTFISKRFYFQINYGYHQIIKWEKIYLPLAFAHTSLICPTLCATNHNYEETNFTIYYSSKFCIHKGTGCC